MPWPSSSRPKPLPSTECGTVAASKRVQESKSAKPVHPPAERSPSPVPSLRWRSSTKPRTRVAARRVRCRHTRFAHLTAWHRGSAWPALTAALPPYQIRTSHRLAPGACLAWAVWVGGGYSFPFLLLAGETDLAGTDCGKAAASWSWQQARQPQFGSGRNFYRGHTAIVTRAPHRMLLNPSPRIVKEPTAPARILRGGPHTAPRLLRLLSGVRCEMRMKRPFFHQKPAGRCHAAPLRPRRMRG